MRKALGFIGLVLLAGCGRGDQNGGQPQANATAESSADQSEGPNVAPTAAPGVAFNFHYTFRLPTGSSGRRKRMPRRARSSASRAAGSPA